MKQAEINEFQKLSLSSTLLSSDLNFRRLIKYLVEQSTDYTNSDSGAFYSYIKNRNNSIAISLSFKQGRYKIPKYLEKNNESIDFILESGEIVVLLSRKESPFSGILLNPIMNSALAVPIITYDKIIGLLFLNSINKNFYNRKKIEYINTIKNISSGVFDNSELYNELTECLDNTEQFKIFEKHDTIKFINLIINIDRNGKIKHFNKKSRKYFGLTNDDIGRKITYLFKGLLNKDIIKLIDNSIKVPEEFEDVKGIYNSSKKSHSFILNIYPLAGKNNKIKSINLLFKIIHS